MRLTVVLACVMTAFASTPGRALDPKLLPMQARIDSMTARAREAIRTGDTAAAVDLFCAMWGTGHANLMDPKFLGVEYSRLVVQRYQEAFTPPANADSMFAMTGGWRTGLTPTFGMIPWAGSPDTSFFCLASCPEATPRGPCYLVSQERKGSLVVKADLDLDGKTDVTFEGREATVAPGLAVVVDRAPDGRRAQWLIGPPGSHPRDKVVLWIYRDGPIYAVVMDTDGDGTGNCAHGGCAP